MDSPAITPPVTSNIQNPAKFFRNRKNLILIVIIGLIIFSLGLAFFLNRGSQKSSTSSQISQETNQTWQVVVSFDTKTKSLTAKEITLLDQTIRPDVRTAADSSYTLYLLNNSSNQILYKSKINITEQLLVDFIPGAETSSSAYLPSTLESVIYIPQFTNATNIKIVNNGKLILDVKLPQSKQSSFNLHFPDLITKVFAQSSGVNNTSTGKLQIVFISDNFTDFNAFHQLVNQLKAKYNSTEPYSSANPSIFDFKVLDNTVAFGCQDGLMPNPSRAVNRPYGCIFNQLIPQVGYSHYPTASKFVVIVNNPNNTVDGGTLGVTNDIGGNVAIFTNRQDVSQTNFLRAATHEVLGHAVGELYDRYVVNANGTNVGFGPITAPPLKPGIKSNCTDNPQGETFWRQAGAGGGFKGCTSPNYYAPIAPSCPGTTLLSGGSPDTVMSSASCGTPSGFDLVEQWWIKNHIIPRYQLAITPSSSPSPSTGPSPNPSPSFSPSPTLSPSTPPSQSSSGCNTNVVPSIYQNLLPILNTSQPINDSTGVFGKGEVNSIAGGTIRVRGFQYYDQASPANCHFAFDLGSFNIGSFQKQIKGLTPNHTYFIRAYAVNDNQVPGFQISLAGYGQWISFTTPSDLSGTSTNSVSQIEETNPYGSTSGDTQTNSSTTTSGSGTSSGGGVFSCREVTTVTNQGGKQLQLTTLQCGSVTTSTPTLTPIPTASPVPTSYPSPIPSPTTSPLLPSPTPVVPVCGPIDSCIAMSLSSCPCNGNLVTCENHKCIKNLVNHGSYNYDEGCDASQNGCATICVGPGNGTFCLGKPVIYLYPTKITNVNVSVNTIGKIIISDPLYPMGGWNNVEAHPDGTLYYQNQKYRELFYETNLTTLNPPNSGIIIKTSQLEEQLTQITYQLGLLESEQAEFLDWWLPKLKALRSPYILFSVLDQKEKARTDSITITPKPDTFIDFIAYFKPLYELMSISPLNLPVTPPDRIGFTAVEWGGVIDTK